jgi:hypothetical protein
MNRNARFLGDSGPGIAPGLSEAALGGFDEGIHGPQRISLLRNTSIPLKGQGPCNAARMTKTMKLQDVIAHNVNRLMELDSRQDVRTTLKLAKKAGVSNGSVHRMRNAMVACQIDTLAAVAAVFGLEAWHLFIPGIDPKDKPTLLFARDRERQERIAAMVHELQQYEAGRDPGDDGTRRAAASPPTATGKRIAHRKRRPQQPDSGSRD